MLRLPPYPNLSHLKKQVKRLLQAQRSGDSTALARLDSTLPDRESDFPLLQAQLVVAREYGFENWQVLKTHVQNAARPPSTDLNPLTRSSMMEQPFFPQGSIDDAARQAAELHTAYNNGDSEARDRVHRIDSFAQLADAGRELKIEEARTVIAREGHFHNWSKLQSFLELVPQVRAVIEAANSGNLERLENLLAEDPTTANPSWRPGFTPPDPIPNDSIPLHHASEGVHRKNNTSGNEGDIAQRLLQAGARPDIQEGTPMSSAASFGTVAVVEVLLDFGAAVDGVAADGLPLIQALLFGFDQAAEVLAARSATVDLPAAAGLGRLDLLESFFQADGSLKPQARTCTYSFNTVDHLLSAAELLSQGLAYASINNRTTVARWLIEHGAQINAFAPGLDLQCSALHRAAWRGHREMAELLIERGANLQLEDGEFGGTPLGWAVHAGHREMLDLLCRHLELDIFDAVQFDQPARVEALLASEPSLANAVNPHQGARPLHWLHARLRHGRRITELLLDAGAQINAINTQGETPVAHLERAAKGADELAALIRQRGGHS
jgi:ankyrin repeat protein